ncbi:SDR family oxidoreductase [Actinoallomurus spadix]|uniref:SDR family oxidoreductase n=1 Tax=Actinoallomurus spadix TaxID=79912 RepID=A0ABN0W1H2_9ACTN|nr:SDR family oxidoreductase [Actinoallomurus spadix]MCO5985372.1 SDR family oxidoreductase [Actinoallomurus spadix]
MPGSSSSSGDRRILVTGASSGIGRAVARRFAREGWTVLGTSRHPETLRDPLPGVTYLRLDQSDLASIHECAKAAEDVDVLVNNAGESQGGPIEHLDPAAIERLFQVDVFGPLELTRRLLPRMRDRGHGHVVFVGSLMADFPVPFQGGYAAAKTALRAFATALRAEVAPFGVRVSVLQPGYYRSEINDRREWHTAPDSPYEERLGRVMDAVGAAHAAAGDPAEVAARVARLVASGQPPAVSCVGSHGSVLRFVRRFVPDRTAERMVAHRYGLATKRSVRIDRH